MAAGGRLTRRVLVGRGRTGSLLAAVLAGVALAMAAPARAEPIPSPNLEALLPDTPAPASVQPHPVANCEHASIACIDGLERRLRTLWRPLDAACDHRAMFALSYLRITEGLRRLVAAGRVRYPTWLEYVITDFSNHYLQYFHDYEAGRPIPHSWQLTYDAAMHGDTSAPQDVLLASSAHTQHDLPFIYAAMGTRTPGGASRKPDHDAVNVINDSVFRGLEDYGAAHYDPQFATFELAPLELDRLGTLQVVQLWRETAWRNGLRLLNARSRAEYDSVVASIDATADTWAQLILAPTQSGYRATRDAYCAAHRAR
jgi:hypothetical protein